MRRSIAFWLLVLAPALSGCSVTESEATGTPTSAVPASAVPASVVSGPPLPQTLRVECSLIGLTVSSNEVAATSAGVRVSVTSTAAAGTYVNFSWTGGGQGDPAPRRTEVWTLPIPPGDLQISCSTPTKEGPRRTIQVLDPHRHWRATTMSDVGCPPGVTPGWVIPGPGVGATPQDAVKDLLASMTGPDWSRATVARAPVGYPDAPVQTWIASQAGRPEISVIANAMGASFEALPDTYCHT